MSNSPFPSKRAPAYQHIPDEKWNDWRWQLTHRLNTIEDFEALFPLTPSEKEALSSSGLFRVCLLYTSPSPRDRTRSRMPSSA